MNFINHTPFPAQAFEGIDQQGLPFHVVVLRQTLSFASGTLEYAQIQAPLCESDAGFDDSSISSVRQESDLCQYKPRCDVIVNATAYAPSYRAHKNFTVSLIVNRPATPAPIPRKPQGLNQFESAAPDIMARWRQQVEYAREHPIAGTRLIDKTLQVTGLRQFKKKSLMTRALHWVIRLGTLSILRPNPWKLTKPRYISTLPLRHEFSYGGECRINAGEPAAQRLSRRKRLTGTTLAAHPDSQLTPPLIPAWHTVCAANVRGSGFSDSVYLKATGTKTIIAPAIEHMGKRIDAHLFRKMLQGKWKASSPDLHSPFEPAGFCIRPKTHPLRQLLAGTIDQAFIDSGDALPADFDFACWNAAPPDQQIAFLQGDETVQLTNMCAPDTPGATVDTQQNTVLRLTLLRHECFVLCRQKNGAVFRSPLSIDTVLIEPEQRTLTLVWRGVLEKNADNPLRACEARMHDHDERDQMQSDLDALGSDTATDHATETAQ